MGKENINDFQKQRVWALIGLSLITLTFYLPFWFRRQSKIINRLLPSDKITTWLFPLSLGFTILYFGMIIPEVITNNHPAVMLISKTINLIDIIITLVWAFKIRNRLNYIFEAEKDHGLWFNGSCTFLFTSFYIQYKINKIKKYRVRVGVGPR